MKSHILSITNRFLTFHRRKRFNFNFNIELVDIPYSEIAQMYATMDIINSENNRRLKEANELFNDITEFFESEAKRKYLTTVISKDNVEQILLEVEECFIEAEHFEKCAKIKSWRVQLNEK